MEKTELSRPSRSVAAVLAMTFILAACGGSQRAEVRTATADSATGANGEQTTSGQGSADDGISSLGEDMVIQRFTVPYVPPIVLPDVSVLTQTGSVVEAALGDSAAGDSGLDVISAECAADGGELVYSGTDASGSFFDVSNDGSGSYAVDVGDAGNVDVTVEADGSGSYELTSGPDGNVSIDVNADGSGEYGHIFGENGNLSIEVDGDGYGQYSRVFGDDGNVGVSLNADGSGSFSHVFGEEGNIDLTVNADGSGLFEHVFSEEGNITVEAGQDGSRFYRQTFGPDGNVEIKVNADGSGSFSHTFSEDGNIEIEVDAAGNGTYSHTFGPFGNVETTFTTDIGILDPQLLVIDSEPTFAVADRFPPLATLGAVGPACATVIRLDSTVLFDFDSDQLRPEAGVVIAQVGAALASSDNALEVHGHTDSVGDDAYNQDLSERRAQTFSAALLAEGVTSDITTEGFGETRPVAANETADGADNPTGRQLNRRIEVVIPE